MATPFRRTWAGTTDAQGNFTSQAIIPFAAYPSNCIVSGQAQGSPGWQTSVNGAFLLPATGDDVAMGFFRCQPQDQITIKVSGATPNMQLSGTIWGYVSDNQQGSDLPVPAAIANNSSVEISGGTIEAEITGPVDINGGPITVENVAGGSLTTQTTDELIGTVICSISVGATISIDTSTLAPGARTLALFIRGPGVSDLLVIGQQSGDQYYAISGPLPQGFIYLPLTTLTPVDTNLSITLTFSGIGQVPVYECFDVYPPSPLILAPAPWQAPSSTATATVTTNSSTPLLAAASGVTYYLHEWELSISNQTAGILAYLEDTSGNIIAELAMNGTWAGNGSQRGDKKGRALPPGIGVNLVCSAGISGGTVRGILDYSST